MRVILSRADDEGPHNLRTITQAILCDKSFECGVLRLRSG